MELEDERSDLQALRRLYGLLESNPDNPQIMKTDSLLDARARLLLKRLLDAATDKLLETHSKIIAAAQPGASNKPFYSPNMLRISSSLGRDSKKDISSDAVRISRDKQNLDKQKPPKASTVMSPTSLSSNVSEMRKKRCRICEESNTKHQNSGTIPGGDSSTASNRIRIHQLQRNESNASSVACSSGSLFPMGVKLPQTKQNFSIPAVKSSETGSNDFAEEVANAIERIETQISALQLFSDRISTNDKAFNSWLSRTRMSSSDYVLDQTLRHAQQGIQVNSNVVQHPLHQGPNDSPAQKAGRKGETGYGNVFQTCMSNLKSNSELRHQIGQNSNVFEFNASPSQRTSHGMKAGVKRAESLSPAASQSSQYVHGLRIPQTLDNAAVCLQPVPVKSLSNVVKSRLSLPPRPMTSIGTGRVIQKDSMSPKVIMKPTLLDQESQSWYENPRDLKIGRMRVGNGSLSKFQPRKQESEDESTSSYTCSRSSSSWTSQPTSISDSDTESSPSQTKAYHSIGSSSRSNADVVHPESSGESNSSYSTQSHHDDKWPSLCKADRSGDYPNSKKNTVGRLRRFKNKLGLIFHHHHHHHHHHHDNFDDDSDHSEDGHRKPAWKNLYKMFHRKNKQDSYENEAADRVKRKSGAANSIAPRQHQTRHFHTLVEGLMRHVRHSKKSKGPSKKGIGRLNTRLPGHRSKVVKKSHLWQMVRRQGGVKLPNRGRVKLGHTSKKHQLRTPKKK